MKRLILCVNSHTVSHKFKMKNVFGLFARSVKCAFPSVISVCRVPSRMSVMQSLSSGCIASGRVGMMYSQAQDNDAKNANNESDTHEDSKHCCCHTNSAQNLNQSPGWRLLNRLDHAVDIAVNFLRITGGIAMILIVIEVLRKVAAGLW